ncbi:MAG: aldo/keto reductase [Sandaracinaceae bacterium]|nr:aldo/keto reductase [Sandaracinaceae bacterium]
MRNKRFGPTEWNVSAIGLGGMPLSIDGRPSQEDAIAVVHASLDAGVTLIDTADVYCLDDRDIGHNEQLIAKALWSWSGDHDSVLVCTKGGLRRPRGAWVSDGRERHLKEACARSLASLGVDAIDVYQLHAPDSDVPFEESVGALARLREAGMIKHVGLSNVSVAEIEQAQAIVPIVSVQNRCNVFDRRAWSEGVIAKCEADGLAFLPYSPVGGGRGKVELGRDSVLCAVGERHGVSPYQVALAWLLAKSNVMFPIPGAKRIASAEDSARAADLTLSAADLAELDAAFPVA